MLHLLSDQYILQLQKGSSPWALKHSEMEKHGNNWKEVGKRGCNSQDALRAKVCAKG